MKMGTMKVLPLLLTLLLLGFSVGEDSGPVRTEPVYITTELSKGKEENKDHYTVYRVYALGVAVGEVYFSIKDNKIEARGNTYKRLKFLYNYDFVYLDYPDYIALYEKENDKERVYQNEEIYEKKPWLPIVAIFFREKTSDEKILNTKVYINNSPLMVKKSEDEFQKSFHFIPTQSKTKRISIYIKKGESLPYLIDIEGKTNITLERITQQ